MLIATLLTSASIAFAHPQTQAHPASAPPASASPAAGDQAPEQDASSVELVAGELVIQSVFFETLTDQELTEFTQRLHRSLSLPEKVFLYPDADHRFHTFRWEEGDLEPLRKRLKDVLHFERNSRELEHARLMRQTATLDFKGGTLGSYIDSLVQHFALPTPVFDPPELRAAVMPAVQLNRLDLASAFALPGSLSLMDESKSTVRIRVMWVGPGSSGIVARAPTDRPLDDYRQSVCIISRVVDKSANGPAESRRAIINLMGEKGQVTSSELRMIMEAIQVAIDFDGRSPTFKAKYHEPSGLLIVQGTNDELGVAAQVVRAKLPQSRIELPGGTAGESPSVPILKDIPILEKKFTPPAPKS